MKIRDVIALPVNPIGGPMASIVDANPERGSICSCSSFEIQRATIIALNQYDALRDFVELLASGVNFGSAQAKNLLAGLDRGAQA